MLKNSSILITGGTGSFGNAFVSLTLKKYKPKRLVIFSRDEMKQWEMARLYKDFPQVRFFIGDIRDKTRIHRALNRVDFVVHAAATKIVPSAEQDPFECIKTNVNGAMNLIDACIDQGVKRVIALSTDKASSPINLYGASKLASDKLFVASNSSYASGHKTCFSVVRYGNVMGSRGSVIPFFLEQAKKGMITITDPKMTRFNISLDEGVDMVINVISESLGGEIFVPMIPSYRILDVAEAISPSAEKKIIGIRPGEKLHEEMITAADSFNTYDLGNNYIIFPSDNTYKQRYLEKGIKLKPIQKGFSYNSGTNLRFLSVKDIRNLIIKNIDSKFTPI